IAYNQFNLPMQIDFVNNRETAYIYTSSGEKIARKHTNENDSTKTTYYMGPFVFEQLDNAEKTLSYLLTPNGRLLNKGDNNTPVWEWEYFLTDHLGNVRTVITPGSTEGIAAVKQINNYYPFGLKMSLECYNISDNRYMFGAKELDDHFGLGWSFFGGRNNYYSALGIWHTVDPMAEKYSFISSYAYCLNNPLKFIDPDGREVFLALQGEAQNKALSKFMSSAEGRAFIGRYANAGQVIAGYKFESTGAYAQRGIDLRLRTSSRQTMGYRLGTAITYLKNSKSGYKRLQKVREGDLPSGQHQYETIIDLRAGETAEKSAYVLGHEAFVHADNDAQQLIEAHDKGEAAKYNTIGDFVKDLNNADLDAGEEHSDLKNDLIESIMNYVKSMGLNEKTDYYEKLYEKDKSKY
ncbi:MAG: hypothetical protein JW870_12370, partial [Candidatus Delongbacteria bacterium]|nr:hypothetical protein [Candidatus Delongbacteria bacterium]